MVSKQNLDYLVLCWGMPNNYSEGARSNGSEAVVLDLEVLDALKPCNKLKVLQITQYRGDKFPVWMTEYQMLKSLVEMYIIECRRCTNVPPLHRLPLLQILHIKCMNNLKHLCSGAFMSADCGEDSHITFPALKFFILEEMPNLEHWCEGDVGEKTSLVFPVLRNVWITDCPKLNAIPVTPLLEKMRVKRSKTQSSLATGITNVRNLTLEGRGGREKNADETLSFKPWESPSFKPWKSLQELTIRGFNHIVPPTTGRECKELSVDVNATALRKLWINSSNFWFSPIPSNSPLWLWKCFRFLEFLYIKDCDSLTTWPEEEFSNLIYLREMNVDSCRNFLGSLSEPPPEMSRRQVLLPKLEYLKFLFCPNMVEVPQLPNSLLKLEISGSAKLECLPEWLGTLMALKELHINSCQSLSSLPSSIGCLIALTVLCIFECPNMVEVPKLPRSLEILKMDCKKLASLPEGLGSLVVLKQLEIYSCESLNSFPSSMGRLISLERLWIDGCINLEFLPEGMQGLEALKTLAILRCPKIRILPEGLLQRLRSLDYLRISMCPLSKRDFQKHSKYWHLISEIPDVMIGKVGQSSKIGDLTQLISACKILKIS